ncbi:MAG: phage holin family protein [Polyangiaceae bacterium]|nr:phage holin family protein [Polyangiaceae bacterium]
MTEQSAEGKAAVGEPSILMRAFRAFELLFSVHAKLAAREAGSDFRRVVTAIVTIVVAAIFITFALILAHGAAILIIHQRYQMSYPLATLTIAGADALVALFLSLTARSKLSQPVLPETRAMVKKAATVLRG